MGASGSSEERAWTVFGITPTRELAEDEIDMKQATLWRNFRMFAVAAFKSAEDPSIDFCPCGHGLCAVAGCASMGKTLAAILVRS